MDDAPTGLLLPVPQAVQAEVPETLYKPAAQAVDEPLTQKEPAGHTAHCKVAVMR